MYNQFRCLLPIKVTNTVIEQKQINTHTHTHDMKYLYWKLPVDRLIYKTITQTG